MSKKVEVDKSAEFEQRRKELRAMVDAFLGRNYDREKFRQLDGLHKTMHQQQVVLCKHDEEGDISSAQFFDLQIALFAAIFREIKKVIGARDYRKLFGTNSLPQPVDRKTFLKLEAERKNKKV